MATWQRTIEIDAKPDRVWEIMSDVEKWPEWTPSVISVERTNGAMGPGASAVVHPRGTPKSTWRVTEWRPGRSFTWETKVRGARTIGGHVVEPIGEDRSRVTLSIEVQGFVAALARPFLNKGIEENLEAESEGLKRRSETGG